MTLDRAQVKDITRYQCLLDFTRFKRACDSGCVQVGRITGDAMITHLNPYRWWEDAIYDYQIDDFSDLVVVDSRRTLLSQYFAIGQLLRRGAVQVVGEMFLHSLDLFTRHLDIVPPRRHFSSH